MTTNLQLPPDEINQPIAIAKILVHQRFTERPLLHSA
jgi:hypothetical protein